MKKIIIALVLIAGLGTLVYQSTQSAKLSKAERDQARVLVSMGSGGNTGSDLDYVSGSESSGSGSTAAAGSGSTVTVAKSGCQNMLACNYDASATTDGGTCNYAFWGKGGTSQTVELFNGAPGFGGDEEQTRATEFELLKANPNDSSVSFSPKQSVCAQEVCESISLVSWSSPASKFAPKAGYMGLRSEGITITSKGFVSPKTAEIVNGRKACDQIAGRKNTSADKKVLPVKRPVPVKK